MKFVVFSADELLMNCRGWRHSENALPVDAIMNRDTIEMNFILFLIF